MIQISTTECDRFTSPLSCFCQCVIPSPVLLASIVTSFFCIMPQAWFFGYRPFYLYKIFFFLVIFPFPLFVLFQQFSRVCRFSSIVSVGILVGTGSHRGLISVLLCITVHRQAFRCFSWNPGHEN